MGKLIFESVGIEDLPGPNPDNLGYVYMIGVSGIVKIGCSCNPQMRITLQIGEQGMSEVKVFISQAHENYYGNERAIQIKHWGKRLVGEWFNVSIEKIEKEYDGISLSHFELIRNDRKLANKVSARHELEKSVYNKPQPTTYTKVPK